MRMKPLQLTPALPSCLRSAAMTSAGPCTPSSSKPESSAGLRSAMNCWMAERAWAACALGACSRSCRSRTLRLIFSICWNTLDKLTRTLLLCARITVSLGFSSTSAMSAIALPTGTCGFFGAQRWQTKATGRGACACPDVLPRLHTPPRGSNSAQAPCGGNTSQKHASRAAAFTGFAVFETTEHWRQRAPDA